MARPNQAAPVPPNCPVCGATTDYARPLGKNDCKYCGADLLTGVPGELTSTITTTKPIRSKSPMLPNAEQLAMGVLGLSALVTSTYFPLKALWIGGLFLFVMAVALWFFNREGKDDCGQ